VKILENEQPDLSAGLRIGHYEICERIGAGGMGEVYLASDLTAGRKAALKFLPRRYTGNAERLKRFQQEARAVVALNHPNIVTVYEVGEYDSSYYIASELIEGETLRQRLERGRMELDKAIDVATQVATALAAAHDAGIVHRDIKPENIMLRPDGYVKVLDFGIAKLAQQELAITKANEEQVSLVNTNLGSKLGTARYMSPEQARGEPVGNSSDIWSLGVVLYEMLTGSAAFTGATREEVITAILGTQPPLLMSYPAEIPGDVREIISKTLHKESRERYATAGELTQALKRVRRRIELRNESLAIGASYSRRIWPQLVAGLLVLVLGVGLGIVSYFSRRPKPTVLPPEKSIAVLPFENLSAEKENTYFATGVQDEILTDLARIADLKVISRTSTRPYDPGQPRNSREIGEQLGVAHLLEGSVQRSSNRLRINVQLIDARSDSHLWAQTYDRQVADVFAIQSEIAQTIANQLQARISASEKAAIAGAPTNDLVANGLYLQAMALEFESPEKTSLLKAIDLLDHAIARDPRYVRAYCALARLHLELYEGEDHTATRLQSANANIAKAAQLQPDSGEVHLVRAHYLARGIRDYDAARAELELARRVLPNDPAVYFETALMDRHQGRWAEALRNFDRAVELDPRNLRYLDNAAVCYSGARRYVEATRLAKRELALSPHNDWVRIFVASQPLNEQADIRPLRRELDAILAEEPAAAPFVFTHLWECAILQHDVAAADRALAAIPPEGFRGYLGAIWPREWFVGYTSRIFNRPGTARTAFVAAREILEKHLREQPDHALSWSLLGRVKAMLGEKQEAIEAGQRACELWPLSREPIWGLVTLQHLAVIYAWVGEKDLALQQLSLYTGQPAFVDYGELKLHPDWDPLRGDPRFEKIAASLAPRQGTSN
jgi:serine/threonine protein kinase/Tfp pilus assembly protein PilF